MFHQWSSCLQIRQEKTQAPAGEAPAAKAPVAETPAKAEGGAATPAVCIIFIFAPLNLPFALNHASHLLTSNPGSSSTKSLRGQWCSRPDRSSYCRERSRGKEQCDQSRRNDGNRCSGGTKGIECGWRPGIGESLI
jgi:hypothetical protein